MQKIIIFQNKPILTILIIGLLFASIGNVSANSHKDINPKFKHLTVEDGLSHHETLFVFQDTQGFMWFGTKHGLNKYDGMVVTPYFDDPAPEKKNSLVGNFAHWIHEDKNGVLWISTWGDGISKYDPQFDTFTNYQHEDDHLNSLASNNVWSLFVDSKGFVWAATDNGLSQLKPETKTFVNYKHDPKNPKSLSHNTVSRICEDNQGILWVSTYGGGLNRFDPNTETFKTYKHLENDSQSISNNNLWGVYIDSRQRIWIGSEKGLNRFHPETETFISYEHDETDPESLSSNTVTFIHEDHTGKLWLGTFGGGLNVFDPDRETFVTYRHDSNNPYSLSNDIIMGIVEDKDGAIWIATYAGIDKYDPGEYQFEYYNTDLYDSKHTTTQKVRSIFQDKQGSLWIGTGGDGLVTFNNARDRVESFLHKKDDPSSISDNDIWAISQDRRGDLWIATHAAGLNQFNSAQKKFVHYAHDPNNSNTPACDPLYDLEVDKKRDVLWIAAYLSGLDKLDLKTKTFTHYRYDPHTADGIVSNWSTTVFVDSKGLVWIGTEAGLSLFNPETEQFRNFRHDRKNSNSLSANMIQCIYEDSKNSVWIGTSGGLNKYDENAQSFERYTKAHGLAGNHVAGITEDNNGYLWISTDQGLSKFNSQEKTFRNYNQHDGLQGDRFLMHSVFKNNAGELFFGGTNGINAFHPDALEENHHIPKIALTSFQLFNQPVKVGENSILKRHINQAKQIELDHEQNVFTIAFAALNYRNSQNNQYAYMMEGFDKDYRYSDGNQRSATYTNLDAGQYIFRVIGTNNDGVWNKEGTSIKIIVKPPWWEAVLFKVFVGLVFLCFVLAIIKYIYKLRFEIEERKSAEKALKDSQERFQLAMEFSNDGLFDWNLETSQIYYSPGWKKMLGYEDHEIKNDFSEWERLTKPEDAKASWTMLNEVLEGKRSRFEMEFQMAHKDGHWVDILSRANIIFNDEGKGIRVVGTHVNISGRKKMEKELRESEEKYRLLYENAGLGIGYWTPDGKVISFNKTATENLKGEPDDFIGKSAVEVFGNVNGSIYLERTSNAVTTRQTQTYEDTVFLPSGEKTFLSNYTAVVAENGDVLGVQIISTEITERKGMEKDILKIKTSLEDAQRLAHVGNWEWDLRKNDAWWSDELYRIYGREKSLGPPNIDNFYSNIHSDDIQDLERAINNSMKTGEYKVDYRLLTYDTRQVRDVHAEGKVFYNDKDEPIKHVGVVKDITDQKKLEMQLRQAHKMESVGNLAGGIAHDFNNILSAIIGFTELALDEAPKGTIIEDSLQEVYSAGKRARDLVKQILAFARQSDEKRGPIRTSSIVKEVLNFIRSTIPTTIDVRQNIESESLFIGNETQIHQVLMNLCTNAAQAMEESGGVLNTSVKDVIVDKEHLSNSMIPGDYVEIKVSDTGTGIAPEILESIYEPYFTTKEPGEGTGMGLAMAKGVIESYGGKINVESQLGKGTIFRIYLPITKERSPQDAYVTEQLPAGTERILLVDDEEPIAKMGSQALERLGYSVMVRTSSVEALELFRSKSDDFDLVITDMTMPNLTGDKLAIELMKIRRDIPIILCTGYSKKITDETASEIGIKAFAYKPVVKADLAKTVRKVLDARRNNA